jgi:hypothetical protein
MLLIDHPELLIDDDLQYAAVLNLIVTVENLIFQMHRDSRLGTAQIIGQVIRQGIRQGLYPVGQ